LSRPEARTSSIGTLCCLVVRPASDIADKNRCGVAEIPHTTGAAGRPVPPPPMIWVTIVSRARPEAAADVVPRWASSTTTTKPCGRWAIVFEIVSHSEYVRPSTRDLDNAAFVLNFWMFRK